MMWDERYSGETYAYGKAANTFLAGHFAAWQVHKRYP